MKGHTMSTGSTPVEDEAGLKRLDTLAAFLLTATTVVTAVWTAAGLTADRFPALLNSSGVKWDLLGAFGAAGLAVILGAVAQGVGSKTSKTLLIALGTSSLVLSMGFIVKSTALAFTEDGRPTVNEVSISTPSETTADVTFTIQAEGVSRDTHVLVFASWVRNSSADPQQRPFFTSTVRPNPSGVVGQKVTMTLSRPATSTLIRLQTYRLADDPAARGAPVGPPPGSSCSDQADQKTAPACLELLIPAAVVAP